MKAAVLVKYGAAKSAFEIQDWPDPKPVSDQVVIQTEASGLNYADVMARKGMYEPAPKPPAILGYDVVGRVVEVGSEVDSGWVGKRVTAFTRFGGYAEKVVTHHSAIQEINDDADLAEAAALPTQYCTAWYSAIEAIHLRAGEKILIHSAAGGVGTALIQIANMVGCEVFAVCSSESKRMYLQQQGADHILVNAKGDYDEQAKAVLGSDNMDTCFNPVGGKTFKKDMRLLGKMGRMVIYGGAARKPGMLNLIKFALQFGFIHPVSLIIHSRSIIGVNMLQIGDHKPQVLADCLREVSTHFKNGTLKPQGGGVFPAKDISEAHEALEGRGTTGKLVIQW